jgi:hypothetical protein
MSVCCLSNSWDRREWFFDCALSGSTLRGNCLMPKTIRTQHNMFIGPAGWNMDHDDGSTNYHDYSNLVFQGGYKYRDGTNRNMSNNLMISATPKFQVSGFDTDFYQNNVQVNAGTKVCGPTDLGGLSGNSFLSLNASTLGPNRGETPAADAVALTAGQATDAAQKCDGLPIGVAATSVTAATLLRLAMQTVAHDSVPLRVLV